MAVLTSFRLRWMSLVGRLPSAEHIELRRRRLEEEYRKYVTYGKSEEWRRYQELEQFEASGEAARVEQACRQDVFPGSPEEAKLREQRELSRDAEIRRALKGKGDTTSAAFLRYKALYEEVNSEAFRKRVEYLKDTRKYEKTEAARALRELKLLRGSSGVRWYKKMSQRPDIARRSHEEVVFYDEFSSTRLDTSKWLTRFAWADSMLGQGYSCATDAHRYTEGENISLRDGHLRIETAQRDTEGMAWDDALGFVRKRFSYTSGVLSTGPGFAFEHGLIEAKVRFGGAPGVVHSMYLRSAKMFPHVEVFCSSPSGDGLHGGTYVSSDGPVRRGEVGKLPYSRKFYILSLRRDDEGLVWAINGVPFHEQRESLPEGPLHLVFASAVVPGHTPTDGAHLELDWVRYTVIHP